MEQAHAAIRRGGTAVIVGVAALTDMVSFNALTLAMSAKTIKGCIYGDANPPVDFPRLLDLYKSGKLNLDDMVSRTYSIDEAPQAFEDMKNNANARGVIVF
jgi:S-(hydroxymethyl)glutathione dehydrogenase/alcohol dehydrogenase